LSVPFCKTNIPQTLMSFGSGIKKAFPHNS